MCNLYSVRENSRAVGRYFDATVRVDFTWDVVIAPRQTSPGLLLSDSGERDLVPMRFGLIPVGSKGPDDKRPLNNARVEKTSSWPWNRPFRSQRCVIPISEFREPLYWGEDAGTEAWFTPTDVRYLAAAGVYNIWTSPDKQPIASMSLLMRPAGDYVMENGHHRQPFFIERDGIDAWMAAEDRPIEASKQILRQYAAEPLLEHRVARHMAESWKTRQQQRLKSKEKQLADIEEFGPLGI